MLRTLGRRSNRDGIGARVSVRTGALEQVWEIKRSVGIFSASDPRAHFGLGTAAKVDLLRVAWPSGKLQEFRDVAADAHYLVDEERGSRASRSAGGRAPAPERPCRPRGGSPYWISTQWRPA